MKSSGLKGVLPAIEGEFRVMEDVSGNQSRVHTQTESTWPQYSTQPGDFKHAVDNQIGHAQLRQ